MERCFSTLGCADLALDDVIALAQRHKIGAIELRALGRTVDLPAYFATHFGSPERLAGHVAAASLRIVALDTSLKLHDSSDAEWQSAAESFLPWAEALGAVNLRVFDGGESQNPAVIARMAERVDWWRRLRAARGWRSDIMVETHDSLFTGEAILAFKAVAPAARILWDSHHTWKRGGEDPGTTWRLIAPHVAHVHVKDSISTPSARHPYTYVPPGDGEFPAAPLMASLRSDFAGPVSLEWERLWHPYLPPLDEALRTARARAWW